MDWPLLIFLLLFVNVKLIIKLAAILLIYLWRPSVKLGFRWRQSRLPLFYPAVMGIAVLNWLLSAGFLHLNTSVLLLAGLCFWALCILAVHQVKLSVQRQDNTTLHRTLSIFFIANIVISLLVFASIVWETGAINPYRYQGDFQKYFIGTGDYIKGLSFDTSTTNAVLNALGVIYFLQRSQYVMALLCMGVLLLTGSNMMILLLGAVLLYLFAWQTTKAQKSMIVVCLLLAIVFWSRVSPQNNRYLSEVMGKIAALPVASAKNTGSVLPLQLRLDSLLSTEERKGKIALLYLDSVSHAQLAKNKVVPTVIEKPALPQDNIHSAPFQHVDDTTALQQDLLVWMAQHHVLPPNAGHYTGPGKVLALRQVVTFLQTHPKAILIGAGAGQYSSKLAFKASGLNIAGGYPQSYTYINPAFRDDHLALYLHYFTKVAGLHSLANSPNSVYGQIASEYGLLGILALVGWYFVFFARQYKKLRYSIPLLLLMAGVFLMDYWFEQLSVVVVFEMLLFVNSKEVQT